MKLTPRLKAAVASFGFSFWFFIISSAYHFFSLELFVLFLASALIITQVFHIKFSKGLDIFALLFTKVILGILFITLILLYGILFRILKIDLLRLKKQDTTYWLEMEELNDSRILKQY